MRLATPRKTLLLTFFVTMLLLSTACIRADMGVSVKDDGTGTITLVEAIDVKAFADAMRRFCCKAKQDFDRLAGAATRFRLD